MATAQSSEDKFTCSICYEHLNKPRELPACGHKFCENCLLTYIDNLSSNGSNPSEFQCPNCRVQVTLPKSRDELQNWVKSLEVSGDQTVMNTGGQVENFCGACKNMEISVPAEKYCLDCQESLCTKCARIIHGLKLLTRHSIIDLKGMGENGDENLLFIMANCMKCSAHQENPLLYICRDDTCNTLCCVDCIVDNHRHCDDIVNLKDENVKEEADTKTKRLKEQKERITSKVTILMDFKKTNAAEIKLKSDEIADKIREVRPKVNTIFDVLEENIASSAKAIAKKCCIEAEGEIGKLSDISKALEEHASLIDFLEKGGSSCQMYVLLGKIMQEMNKTEQNFMNIAKESQGFEVELILETALDTFVNLDQNDTDRLASVKEKHCENMSM